MKPALLSQNADYTVCFCLLLKVIGWLFQAILMYPTKKESQYSWWQVLRLKLLKKIRV